MFPFRADKLKALQLKALQVNGSTLRATSLTARHANPRSFLRLPGIIAKEEPLALYRRSSRLAYCSQQSRAKNKEEAKLPPLCRWFSSGVSCRSDRKLQACSEPQ